MRLVYLSVICIVTLLGGLYAQPPPLSPSFSLGGTGTGISQGQAIVYNSFLLHSDANRELFLTDATFTLSGQQINQIVLSSDGDNVTFLKTNNQCVRIDTGSIMTLNGTNPWRSFNLASTVGPVTTYNAGTNVVLTLTNGEPTGLTSSVTFNGQTTAQVLIFTSFTNSTPPFSVFFLDSACVEQGFTCNSCYSSAIGIASNFVCIIAALTVLSILSIA